MSEDRIVKRNISARRVLITSFTVDLSDLILNLTVAWLSGSVVMLAEALQGGADLITSSLLLLGLRRSERRPNRHYRFGHGRELFFWVLMSGMAMLVLTATLSVWFGLQRILHPEEIQHIGLAYFSLLVGLVTNFYAFTVSVRRLRGAHVGPNMWQRFRHSSLIETKATLVLDLLGTVAAGVGLVAIGTYQLTGYSAFDGVGSVIIGLATAVLSAMLISAVKDLLVGRSATSDIELMIRKAAMQVDGIEKVLDLRTMYLGSEKLLVNLEVQMRGGLETREIERLIDEVKRHIKRKAPIVHHIQVELETPSIREP